jgi:hypothetical protein
MASQSTCDQTHVLMSLTMFLLVAVNKSSHLTMPTYLCKRCLIVRIFMFNLDIEIDLVKIKEWTGTSAS